MPTILYNQVVVPEFPDTFFDSPVKTGFIRGIPYNLKETLKYLIDHSSNGCLSGKKHYNSDISLRAIYQNFPYEMNNSTPFTFSICFIPEIKPTEFETPISVSAQVKNFITSANMHIVNCEFGLVRSGLRQAAREPLNLHCSMSHMIESFRALGLQYPITVHANNHANDASGILSTVALIREYKLGYPIGFLERISRGSSPERQLYRGALHIFPIQIHDKLVRVGIVAATDRLNRGNRNTPVVRMEDVLLLYRKGVFHRLRAQKLCDILICSLHGGLEQTIQMDYGRVNFCREISPIFHAIICHGPHVIQPREIFNQCIIDYSSGDTVGTRGPKQTNLSFISKLNINGYFDIYGQFQLSSLEYGSTLVQQRHHDKHTSLLTFIESNDAEKKFAKKRLSRLFHDAERLFE